MFERMVPTPRQGYASPDCRPPLPGYGTGIFMPAVFAPPYLRAFRQPFTPDTISPECAKYRAREKAHLLRGICAFQPHLKTVALPVEKKRASSQGLSRLALRKPFTNRAGEKSEALSVGIFYN